jgi:hypothetical protein
MTIDPETIDTKHGDGYSKDELLAAIEELKNRLHTARTSIHDAFKPEIIDLEQLRRGDHTLDVLFYSTLPNLGPVATDFFRKDAKYPVLVLVNGLQVSFSGALSNMAPQHARMVEDQALRMLEEKLGTGLREKFDDAMRIADEAVREMELLFPNASRRDRY